jgi:hypothetical protein
MKILLAVTAILEGIVGIGLLVAPVLVLSILLNTPLETPGGLFAARLGGAAIITVAICCWKARGFEIAKAAIGVVTAILFYNFAAAAVLVYAGVRLGLQSKFLWPAIVVHAVLGGVASSFGFQIASIEDLIVVGLSLRWHPSLQWGFRAQHRRVPRTGTYKNTRQPGFISIRLRPALLRRVIRLLQS